MLYSFIILVIARHAHTIDFFYHNNNITKLITFNINYIPNAIVIPLLTFIFRSIFNSLYITSYLFFIF